MGFIDDIVAKINSLDQTGDGKVDFNDLKKLADDHGLGDKIDAAKDAIAGPDGKVTLDDAQRIMGDIGKNAGNVAGAVGSKLNDFKNKLSK